MIRTNTTAIGSVMVARGDADALICGVVGHFGWHVRYIRQALGRRPDGARRDAIGALTAIVLDSGPIFMADTHLHADPTPEQLADIACAGAAELRRFGLTPQVAFVSHSNFGDVDNPAAQRMRDAVALMERRAVDFEYEGEMQAEVALDAAVRERLMPGARLSGAANLLIMPSLDAASAAKSVLRALAGGLQVGPILMGFDGCAHVLTPSVTARGVLNAAALAAAGAGGDPGQSGR